VAPARREQTGERRKQSTISWPQPRAPILPAENGQLMAQHEQLDALANSLRRPPTNNRSTAEKAR
jgi:hypothetical protein